MRELQGRVAVVTGGGSGIGRGLALTLAGEGMRVLVSDLEADAAEAVVAEIAAAGGQALADQTSVADPEAVAALAERAYDEFGAVHLLCNNAGVIGPTPVGPESLANWRWILEVNVLGVVHGVSAFVPRMRAQGGESHVVNTASMGGLLPSQRWSAYGASKYAVVGLSESLRATLADDGIGVSVLCPGAVDTRIWEAGRNRPAEFGGPVEGPGRPRALAESGQRLLDPLEVGRRVVQAVRANRLWVITHPERRHQVEARAAELLEAFDLAAKEPV